MGASLTIDGLVGFGAQALEKTRLSFYGLVFQPVTPNTQFRTGTNKENPT